jgi:hypothetical protein
MSFRILEADGGLPKWVLTKGGALGLTFVGMFLWLGSGDVMNYVSWQFKPLSTAECFGDEPYWSSPAAALPDELKAGAPAEVTLLGADKLMAASAQCTMESCSWMASRSYRAAVQNFLAGQSDRLHFLYREGGRDGIEYGWSVMSSGANAQIYNDIRQHATDGLLDMRDGDYQADLLSIHLDGNDRPMPCQAVAPTNSDAQANAT